MRASGAPRNLGGPVLSASRIPVGTPGDQAQDPGRRAPLAWERRASPARYGPVKVTKRGRTEAGSRSIA
jgi:hypothetical protein